MSGGVDLSLIQYLINQQTSHLPPRSFSFAIRVPNFVYEIEYARQSSTIVSNWSYFCRIQGRGLSWIATRAIDILAQPPSTCIEPSMLSIAEFTQTVGIPALVVLFFLLDREPIQFLD